MPLVEHAVDSPLGRWRVAEWRPAPGDVLDGVAECAWHFDGDTPFPRERVFPDGRVEVVVQLAEPHVLRSWRATSTSRTCTGTSASRRA